MVQTTIEVREAPNGSCSILDVVTVDRPGLLVDIVSVLKDINVNVVSAEIDTIGDEARDEFFVTYHGEPLSSPMVQLVTNSLQVGAIVDQPGEVQPALQCACRITGVLAWLQPRAGHVVRCWLR